MRTSFASLAYDTLLFMHQALNLIMDETLYLLARFV